MYAVNRLPAAPARSVAKTASPPPSQRPSAVTNTRLATALPATCMMSACKVKAVTARHTSWLCTMASETALPWRNQPCRSGPVRGPATTKNATRVMPTPIPTKDGPWSGGGRSRAGPSAASLSWASSAAMAGATILGGTITAKPMSVGTTRWGMAMASKTKVHDSACPRSGEARTTASVGTSAATAPHDSSPFRLLRTTHELVHALVHAVRDPWVGPVGGPNFSTGSSQSTGWPPARPQPDPAACRSRAILR